MGLLVTIAGLGFWGLGEEGRVLAERKWAFQFPMDPKALVNLSFQTRLFWFGTAVEKTLQGQSPALGLYEEIRHARLLGFF